MAGITRILNDHYNSNIANFETNIESENLKTVMLKIGERPVGDADQYLANVDQYLAKLPNYKQKRLQGIKKLSTQDKRLAINKAAPQDFADFRVPYNNWGNYQRLGNKQKGDLLTKLGLHNQVGLENWEETEKNKISKLKELDDWFTGYGQTRRFILSQIYASWCDEKGDYCQSSQDIFALIEKVNEADKDKLSIATYDRIIVIEKAENREQLKPEQTQKLTNAFHNWVRDFVQKNDEIIVKIKAVKMDRLRPNLYEDVSSGLVGFFRKLIRAECQYEIELPKLRTFIDRLKTFNKACDPQFSDWDKSDIYGEIIQTYLEQSFRSVLREAQKNNTPIVKADYQTKGNPKVNIYFEFLQTIRNAESLKSKSAIDLLRFNNVYNQLRTTCELIKHHVKQQKDFELMFKKKDKIVKLITTNRDKTKTLIEHKATEDGIFAKIDPIFFDPKTSFPQYEDKNTLESLTREISDLFEKINNHKSTTELSIIEITKKKIFKAPFLFINNKILNKNGKPIPQNGISQEIIDKEQKSPNGFAHKTFDEYYILAFKGRWDYRDNVLVKEDPIDSYLNATKKIIEQARIEQSKIAIKIYDSTIKGDYTLLRDYAGWIWVEMRILIEEIIDYSVRDRLIKEISQLASRISGFAYNLERDEFENQSIYLSDFYTKPESSDKFSNEFKSNCYLYTNESKNSLGLALDFENTIKQKSNSFKKALVYTFDPEADVKRLADKQILPKWNRQDDKINKDGQLIFFDYEYWNQEVPLAYKSFTKPNIDITIADSAFDFPLRFGKNQSRKYFWNKSRGTGKEGKNLENQVHHIFESNSRLKVSSMRLIRKHNPIKEAWEYYLSLAIYRLEGATVEFDLTKSKSIVGVDFGENQLAAFTHSDLQGKYISSRNFDEKLTKHTLELHREMEKQIKEDNFADSKIRRKLGNKLKSAVQKASSDMLKLNLDNNIVVFEQDATGNRKHISTGKEGIGFKKTTLMKGFKLLERSKFKSQAEIKPSQILNSIPKLQDAKINTKDILGLVPTQLTSSICSICGFCHANESKSTFSKKLSEKINLEEFTSHLVENKITETIDIRKYTKDYIGSKISRYEDLFVIDLKTKIAKINNKIETTFAQEIEEFKTAYNLTSETKLPKSILGLFAHRPKWFEGDVETFRCINCGHIEFRSCDRQAALNIARWRVYLEEEFKGKEFNYDKNNTIAQFENWYKQKLPQWNS